MGYNLLVINDELQVIKVNYNLYSTFSTRFTLFFGQFFSWSRLRQILQQLKYAPSPCSIPLSFIDKQLSQRFISPLMSFRASMKSLKTKTASIEAVFEYSSGTTYPQNNHVKLTFHKTRENYLSFGHNRRFSHAYAGNAYPTVPAAYGQQRS